MNILHNVDQMKAAAHAHSTGPLRRWRGFRAFVSICALCLVVIAALCFGKAALADDESWRIGVPVQLLPEVEVLDVRSDSGYRYLQPPASKRASAPLLYFLDCVSFANHAKVGTAHVQFVFTLVDRSGKPQRPLLTFDPVDTSHPGQGAGPYCHRYGYANGTGGLWLVAWINEVRFDDGTIWRAPEVSQLRLPIRFGINHWELKQRGLMPVRPTPSALP